MNSESCEQESGTWCFNRNEFSGSLGDLGTLLPLAIGLIAINGLNATAVLLSVGVFYILAGAYFRITVPVQPMKVIAAYAIARTLSPLEITSAGMIISIMLFILAATGAITFIARVVPRALVRGVQLTTGILLLTKGVSFIAGNAELKIGNGEAEPFLAIQSLGPVPITIILGVISIVVLGILLDNKKIPGAIVVLFGGMIAGAMLGATSGLSDIRLGFHLPELIPFGMPQLSDIVIGLTVLALPQLPMTVGNAVIAQADLTREYFGEQKSARTTPRSLAFSMALANFLCAIFGGMPVCHGAGGLAAHHRFGARTAGSNLMIGLIFITLALLFGESALGLLGLLPFSVLGALLIFAGAQLALMIIDVKLREDLFVVLMVLGIALATNLAIGFGVGWLTDVALKKRLVKI
jgi:sulfate permease, SulP family